MPPTLGGITTFMLNLMASPLSEEFDFRAYTTTRPRKKNVINNYGYSAVLRGGVFRIIQGIWLTAWRLAVFPFRLLFNRIDIVQVQASDYQVFWEGVAYVLIAKLMRRKTLLRIGGHFDHFYAQSSPFMKRAISRALRTPQCLIVQSQFTRKFVEDISHPNEILVLPNWSKYGLRPRANTLLSSPPTALFIANMEAIRKGVEEVIQAMQSLDARDIPIKFHLCAMAPSLIDRVNRLGLRNVAVMTGPIEQTKLLELMHELDIFLIPSHGEGFPNSLIEAMAAGMASIATPVAGVPEIVSDGGAILVPVKDSTALAEAIERLACDPALRRQLGEEARRTVASRYTADAVLPKLAETYRRLGNVHMSQSTSARSQALQGKPTVLISAPSLDTNINVSGVSSVVVELTKTLRDDVNYEHLLVGSPQTGGYFGQSFTSLWNNLRALVTLVSSRQAVFHSNTALEMKSIVRDSVFSMIAKSTGKRVLLHIHGGRYLVPPKKGFVKLALGRLMRSADVVVFLSETERKVFTMSVPSVAQKTTAIYNAISFHEQGSATPRDTAKERLDVVFAGRLVPEKGIAVLLDVARNRFPFPIHFTIYGDGPLRELVLAEARRNPNVTFGGIYRRDDWQRVFRNSDLLLLPSLMGEGMPMAILEAMSVGTIPVATGIASIPEILGNGSRGILIPKNDPQAIIDALCKVRSDTVWRQALHAACREFARKNFDGEQNSKRFLDIYRSLCHCGPETHLPRREGPAIDPELRSADLNQSSAKG
jgi:glycosyltransferase involved in cell wall biosynthesis